MKFTAIAFVILVNHPRITMPHAGTLDFRAKLSSRHVLLGLPRFGVPPTAGICRSMRPYHTNPEQGFCRD